MATITPARAVINLFMKWLIADSPSLLSRPCNPSPWTLPGTEAPLNEPRNAGSLSSGAMAPAAERTVGALGSPANCGARHARSLSLVVVVAALPAASRALVTAVTRRPAVSVQRRARRRLQLQRHRLAATAPHSHGLTGNGLSAVADPDDDPAADLVARAAQADLEPSLVGDIHGPGLGSHLGSGRVGRSDDEAPLHGRTHVPDLVDRPHPERCGSRPTGRCSPAGWCRPGTARCRGCTRTEPRPRWRT